MGFQFGTVELGEIALEIIGDLKTFDLPCAVFQRQNCEVRMAADTIKRKPKGSWIQIRFSCVFFLFLLVAVTAKQDGGIEIFQMRKQELRMQPEIPSDFTRCAVAEPKCREKGFTAGVRCNFLLRYKNGNQFPGSIHFSNQNTVCRQLLKKF